VPLLPRSGLQPASQFIASAPALAYARPGKEAGGMSGFALGTMGYLAVVNLLAFLAFLHDKRAAVHGKPRIAEDRLLALAFLGGSLGAKLAQRLLRHKIRTEPFRQQLNGILAVQLLAVASVYALSLVQVASLWAARP
jgi:uncharacterized membrane protein YsdA (DUF1294 family)